MPLHDGEACRNAVLRVSFLKTGDFSFSNLQTGRLGAKPYSATARRDWSVSVQLLIVLSERTPITRGFLPLAHELPLAHRWRSLRCGNCERAKWQRAKWQRAAVVVVSR